jgi:hypothetical protein
LELYYDNESDSDDDSCLLVIDDDEGGTVSCATKTVYKSFIVLIPQVRLAHKYPNPPWEMIHPPGGDNAVCM